MGIKPEDDLARFVAETVEQFDPSTLDRQYADCAATGTDSTGA